MGGTRCGLGGTSSSTFHCVLHAAFEIQIHADKEFNNAEHKILDISAVANRQNRRADIPQQFR